MATGSHKKFSLQIIIMPTEFKVPRVPRARRYEPPARRSYHGRGRQEYEVRALKPPPPFRGHKPITLRSMCICCIEEKML